MLGGWLQLFFSSPTSSDFSATTSELKCRYECVCIADGCEGSSHRSSLSFRMKSSDGLKLEVDEVRSKPHHLLSRLTRQWAHLVLHNCMLKSFVFHRQTFCLFGIQAEDEISIPQHYSMWKNWILPASSLVLLSLYKEEEDERETREDRWNVENVTWCLPIFSC